MCLLILLVGCKQQEQMFKTENLVTNVKILEAAKYRININCEWVLENINNTTVDFPNQTIELCEYVFPDLFSQNQSTKEK